MKVTSQVLTDIRVELSSYCKASHNTSYKLRSIICHVACASNSGQYVAYIFQEEFNSFICCETILLYAAMIGLYYQTRFPGRNTWKKLCCYLWSVCLWMPKGFTFFNLVLVIVHWHRVHIEIKRSNVHWDVKSCRPKWWGKRFFWVIEVACVNRYILYTLQPRQIARRPTTRWPAGVKKKSDRSACWRCSWCTEKARTTEYSSQRRTTEPKASPVSAV